MNRRLLLVAFLSTLALTILAAGHQLTNAAANMAPPPQHAPAIGQSSDPSWYVIAGGGGKDTYLTDVSMSSSTDGWAVGWTGPSSYGVMMHYDGSTWSRQTVPTGTYSLHAVKMISPTAGWAVGTSPTSNPALLMQNTNGAWQKVAVPAPGNTTGYSDIDIKGNAGWAMGSDSALQFNGTSWTPVHIADNYSAVSVIDGNNAWAVGTNRQALHYTGGSWLPVSLNLTDSLPLTIAVRMRSIHMLDASEGWATGDADYGRCVLAHYTGTSWSSVPCYNYRLYAVRMRTATDVWAAGNDRSTHNGVALHYDGKVWTSAPLPPDTPRLSSLQLPGANDGWIVGGAGTILRLVNGAWTRVQGSGLSIGPVWPVAASAADAKPIDATDANTVWWYGGSPAELYEWSNGIVTNYTTPITSGLYALDMVSSTLGWARTASPGGPNYLLRYSAGAWTTWPMTYPVYAISMIGPDEGWIASGTGFHYLNGALIPEGVPGTSFSMLDSQHGWAIGYDSGVYSYTNGIWAPVTPTLKVPQLTRVRIIGITSDEAWVAGFSESCDPSGCPATPELHHFSGGAWTNIISPTNQLPDDWLAFFDIGKVSATQWWATGKLKTMGSAFLHYKDGTYTTVPAVSEDVKGVSMLPDGTGFSSGVGSVLRLIDLPNKVYLPLIRR